MDAAEKRLHELLDPILDSSGADAERCEFARLVEEEPALVAPLIEQLRIHSLLQWKCEEVRTTQLVLPKVAESSLPVGKRRVSPRRIIAWATSIAAAILIAVAGMTFWYSRAAPEKTIASDTDFVAEVVDEDGVTWSDKTTALENEKMIRPGRVEIESGALSLRFRSGATVVFHGQASMQIESDMLVRLDRGHATAQVPHWATGFTIATNDAQVVDLGTQFGVMARADGITDVVIFEGEVDVKPTGGEGNVQRRFSQGEAARINSKGAIDRIVDVRRDLKGTWSTTNHDASTQRVFRAIRDNIPPSDGSKYYYYQITPGGLVEDAGAYVDRHPHQWNGVTPAGLPKSLLGADYVRTFNDYRYIRNFEIVVEMARPASLYVFFDDRVPTPDWLMLGFKRTGLKIGLDEGPWEGIPDHKTAVGAGNSIDNTFSVWQRRCKAGEAVKLGAVGDSNEARAMYGIAATPLNLESTIAPK